MDNGKIQWFNVDLPDSIEMRKKFFYETEREHMLAADILKPNWADGIPKSDMAIVIAEGLLMYFSREQVKTLLNSLTGSFDRGFLLAELMHPKMMNEKKHDTVKNTDAKLGEYYPPWEPPVSRFRATRKWYFLPSEPPQHIVAAHIFDFTINLLIVILGELLMQYHQIIYREVFLCLRRQKSEVFWNFWEKI